MNWVCCGFQIQMRRLPKPIVAMVAGYAVGGGHILHMMCDLTVACKAPIRCCALCRSHENIPQ